MKKVKQSRANVPHVKSNTTSLMHVDTTADIDEEHAQTVLDMLTDLRITLQQ